jgi:hypothetical protein
MIERDPALDPDTVHEILTSSARRLDAKGRDDQLGWGLIDPSRALAEVDAHSALGAHRGPDKPAAPKPGSVSLR